MEQVRVAGGGWDGTQFNRLLSEALGLEDRHAYDAKSARAVAILRDVLRGAAD